MTLSNMIIKFYFFYFPALSKILFSLNNASSKNMNEYFSKSKEELQEEYDKVKVSVGAN